LPQDGIYYFVMPKFDLDLETILGNH